MLIALLVAQITLVGCATQTTGALPEQARFEKFEAGQVVLTPLTLLSGYSAASREGWNAKQLRTLYDTGRWRELASQVMTINSGSDLSWFYLGRAAEELRYFDAALEYYEKSIEAAKRPGISGCLACAGFSFPGDAQQRKRVVQEFLTSQPNL